MHANELAEELRQAIRRGELPPGSVLVQEQLAKRFNVSRFPVREALRTLVADGLADFRSGGGYAVKQLDALEAEEIYDLRLLIEPSLARYIIDNASPALIGRWQQMVTALARQDIGRGSWVELNYAFHKSMYEAAGRKNTMEILSLLLDRSLRYSAEYVSADERMEEANRGHAVMIEAVIAKDEALLRKLIVSQLLETKEKLVASLLSFEMERRRHP